MAFTHDSSINAFANDPTFRISHVLPRIQKSFIETFGLYEAEVHYCYFGRDEKKPTHIWVNDMELAKRLDQCRCKRPFCDGNHIHVRGNCSKYDFSVIPQPLAKMVADYVNAKLILKDIHRTRDVFGHRTCSSYIKARVVVSVTVQEEAQLRTMLFFFGHFISPLAMVGAVLVLATIAFQIRRNYSLSGDPEVLQE